MVSFLIDLSLREWEWDLYINFIIWMAETHIMKFLGREGDGPGRGGIRTFPHQTYGVSKDSPDHFHQKHTLVGHNSYQYRH